MFWQKSRRTREDVSPQTKGSPGGSGFQWSMIRTIKTWTILCSCSLLEQPSPVQPSLELTRCKNLKNRYCIIHFHLLFTNWKHEIYIIRKQISPEYSHLWRMDETQAGFDFLPSWGRPWQSQIWDLGAARPENPLPGNQILEDFQTHFVDLFYLDEIASAQMGHFVHGFKLQVVFPVDTNMSDKNPDLNVNVTSLAIWELFSDQPSYVDTHKIGISPSCLFTLFLLFVWFENCGRVGFHKELMCCIPGQRQSSPACYLNFTPFCQEWCHLKLFKQIDENLC